MTLGARFAFLHIPADDVRRADRWLAHAAQVLGRDDAPAPALRARNTARREDSGVVGWYLVSANHRMLARSTSLFPSRSAAEAAVDRVEEVSDSLRVHLVSRRQPGAYGWYMSSDGVPAFTSARWFGSERSRRESIQLALTALTLGQVAGTLEAVDGPLSAMPDALVPGVSPLAQTPTAQAALDGIAAHPASAALGDIAALLSTRL